MELKKITVEEIRNLGPCYDPNKYVSETWIGSVLDILKIDEVPSKDRIWVVTRFLSDKINRLFAVWCAREALKLIKNKFDDPKLKPRFASFSKNMQFTFPDLNTSYLMRVNNGKVQSLAEENISEPDIYVKIESGILIDILNKRINPMKAYTTGKLKAKGKLTDLLKLQKLL